MTKDKVFVDTGLFLPGDGELFNDVQAESFRQINKWGIQKHTICEWFTITGEEFGSLAKAILNFHFGGGSKKEIFKEAMQVATLSLKIAKMVKEQG